MKASMNELSESRASEWRLDPPFNARHIFIPPLALLAPPGTGTRVESRMLYETVEAVGYTVGLAEQSPVATGIKRMAESVWPLRISRRSGPHRKPGSQQPAVAGAHRIRETREPRMNLRPCRSRRRWSARGAGQPIGYLMHVLAKMLETLEMALWGTLLAVLLSIPLAYYAAANYAPNRLAYNASRSTISLFRAIPELVSALFLVLAFGFGPIAGFLALGIHGAGFLGKFYAEDIENADRNPQEALQAIGAGKVKTLWYGVLPQVLPQYIAYTLYILDRNVRMATVIGIVGAGGIGLELKGRFDMFNFSHVGTILLIIFITVFLLDWLHQSWAREAMQHDIQYHR